MPKILNNEPAAKDEPTALDGLIQQAEANSTPEPEPVQATPNDGLEDDLFAALKMAQAAGKGGVWWMTETEFLRWWGDDTLRAMSIHGAEIMRRHGVTMTVLLSKWGPYLGMAAVLAPSVIATVQAYRTATRAETRTAPEKHYAHDNGSAS